MFTKVSERQYKRLTRNKRGSNQHQVKHAGLKTKTWVSVNMICLILLPVVYFGNQATLQNKPLFISPLPVSGDTTPVFTPSKDARVNKVHAFLDERHSPLAPYAATIVKEADTNDISWTLVVAISGKESSFGKNIKTDSHNAWGVMSWNAQGRSVRAFDSWSESIAFESKLLADNYRENMNRAIQEKYCPSSECSSTWVATVTDFQEEVNN